MATLIPLWTHRVLTDTAEIATFLAARGVAFERWAQPPEVSAIAAQDRLSDADKATVLARFRQELADKRDGDGYRNADVIALRPDVPGVDEILAKFDKVHRHDDNEVRAIIGGAGVFGFAPASGRQFLLEVTAGDYLSVPAGAWHWFYTTPEKNITALRLFRDAPRWEAVYRDAP